MSLGTNQLAALSRFFSSSVFHELARKGRSPMFARLLRQSDLLQVRPNGAASVAEAFDSAFALLQRGRRRDEYVYRAALTHKVLLGRHSLNTASMLNEFRVADCKADLAILNGVATVFEIKSERDSLSRLEKQVETYKKVFASVNVIAGENHIESVLRETPPDVGVMRLSGRQQISTVREAGVHPDQICPITVCDCLRIDEAKQVLRVLGKPIPEVPNTRMHFELSSSFAKLAPRDVHAAMVRTLKKTRNQAPLGELIEGLPSSLYAAALSTPLRRSDHDRLLGAIRTPILEAYEWV